MVKNDGEYIKRDDVLKIISDVRLMSTGHTDNLSEVVECISNLKAGDVAPVVHAEWYGEADGYADGELVYDIWSCPICGTYFEEWDEKPTWNFCPQCGARMDGAE